MKNPKDFYDKIEAYLSGRLSPHEMEAMQLALENDEELAREVAIYRLEFETGETLIAQDIRNQFRPYRNKQAPAAVPPKPNLRYYAPAIVLSSIVLLGLMLVLFFKKCPASALPLQNSQPQDTQMKDTSGVPPLKIEEEKQPFERPKLQENENPPVANSPFERAEQNSPVAANDPSSTPEKPRNDRTGAPDLPDLMASAKEYDPKAVELAKSYYTLPDLAMLEVKNTSGKKALAIQTAIENFENKKYPEAIYVLSDFKSDDTLFEWALFIKGHSYYMLKFYHDAFMAFKTVAANKRLPFYRQAEWYYLLAAVANNRTATGEFREELQKIVVNKQHPYQSQAAALAENLGLNPKPEPKRAGADTFSADCEPLITINAALSTIQSQQFTIVKRGTYAYRMQLVSQAGNIKAEVFSEQGELFNQNDELVFVDENNARRSYRFITMGNMVSQNGSPIHQNTLELDPDAITWFARIKMINIYIKNNVRSQMLKFTINPERQSEFQQAAKCFSQAL